MKILHYALGFPPYRTGGLTKYCMDLMEEQIKQGHEVGLLWPGRINQFVSQPSIRKTKGINGIKSYEVVNPLPVPLDEGIKEIEYFMLPANENIYKDFLQEVNPDMIHIHTLMGLHKELVIVANKLNIKTIFTTHDYFGICPKVTLFKNGSPCISDNNCKDCISCNQRALSLNKIKIMQSPVYRKMKNFMIIRYLRDKHRRKYFDCDMRDNNEKNIKDNMIEKYSKLRAYYISTLSKIDLIHFNSTVAERVYKKYFIPKNSVVFNIMHKDVKDRRKVKEFSKGKLRITYLAPAKSFKGYNVLIKALNEIYEEGNIRFELNLFNQVNEILPYMKVKSHGYKYNDLEEIFEQTDVLITPSVWYETFGFTVIEALSFGVPVIVTENVGAKDIIGNCGWIVRANSAYELKKVINSLTIEKLKEKNKNILSEFTMINYSEFVKMNNFLFMNDKVVESGNYKKVIEFSR